MWILYALVFPFSLWLHFKHVVNNLGFLVKTWLLELWLASQMNFQDFVCTAWALQGLYLLSSIKKLGTQSFQTMSSSNRCFLPCVCWIVKFGSHKPFFPVLWSRTVSHCKHSFRRQCGKLLMWHQIFTIVELKENKTIMTWQHLQISGS